MENVSSLEIDGRFDADDDGDFSNEGPSLLPFLSDDERSLISTEERDVVGGSSDGDGSVEEG